MTKVRIKLSKINSTVEPRFNEVAGDRPNLFVKWRVCYIEVLFHTFYGNFGWDIEIISFVISRISLNRGSLNRGSTVSTYGSVEMKETSKSFSAKLCARPRVKGLSTYKNV